MPEEDYGSLGVTVPDKEDKPISLPTFFKDFADSVGDGQTKGKLLIAQNTGAAAWKAMKGDATLAADGTLTIGSGAVNAGRLADGAVTNPKLATGAVQSSNIATGAVGEAKLADGVVTSRKLKPMLGRKALSADIEGLSTSASFSDLALSGGNLTITPAVDSLLKVDLVVEARVSATNTNPSLIDATLWTTINLDGEDQSPKAVLLPATVLSNLITGFLTVTIAQTYLLSLSAESHTIKLRGRKVSGQSSVVVGKEGTGFTYLLVAS